MFAGTSTVSIEMRDMISALPLRRSFIDSVHARGDESEIGRVH